MGTYLILIYLVKLKKMDKQYKNQFEKIYMKKTKKQLINIIWKTLLSISS